MRQPGSDARYLASIALSNSLRIELLLAPVAEAFSPSVTSIPISLKTGGLMRWAQHLLLTTLPGTEPVS
jgi:hypothetical protein